VMEGAYNENSPRGKLFPKGRVSEKYADYITLSADEINAKIAKLEAKMYNHAHNLEFEDAAMVRDEIHALKESLLGK
jgi:excinuclease ABC subunit B